MTDVVKKPVIDGFFKIVGIVLTAVLAVIFAPKITHFFSQTVIQNNQQITQNNTQVSANVTRVNN